MGYHILTEDEKQLSAETGEHIVTTLPTGTGGSRYYSFIGMRANRHVVKRPGIKRSSLKRSRRRR